MSLLNIFSIPHYRQYISRFIILKSLDDEIVWIPSGILEISFQKLKLLGSVMRLCRKWAYLEMGFVCIMVIEKSFTIIWPWWNLTTVLLINVVTLKSIKTPKLSFKTFVHNYRPSRGPRVKPWLSRSWRLSFSGVILNKTMYWSKETLTDHHHKSLS